MAIASGILNSDEVIFYHPLNDFTERTQLQTWSGSAGFTGGKIPFGLSAITTNVLEFNERYNTVTINAFGEFFHAVNYDSEHSALIPGPEAIISGTTITFSNPEIDRSFKDAVFAKDEINTWSLVVAYANQVANYRITKDTNVLSWGGFDSIVGVERLGTLDSNAGTFLVGLSTGELVVGTLNGLTATFGSGYSFTTSSSFSVLAVAGLSSGVGVIIYRDNDAPRDSATVARVASVSGNSITFGPETLVTPSGEAVTVGSTASRSYVSELDSSRFLFAYKGVTNPTGSGIVGEIVDDTVTFGLPVEFFSDPLASAGPIGIHAGKSIDNKVPITYCARYSAPDWHGFTLCRVMTVSGTTITAVGGQTIINSTTTPSFAGAFVGGATAFLESGIVITHYRDFEDGNKVKAVVGQFSSAALMNASSGDAYPVASGNDRIILATWARNITKDSSVITIERDYQIELSNTSITLGPASVAWSGSAISGVLMGEMNDGSSHLLILDFEHTGGGSWNLNTSIDGAPWIGQGAGNGSQSINPSGSDPNLDIANGESDQWLDELVMWAGDKTTFDKFTNVELVDLYNLANTFGLEMDQYGQMFMISSSSNLYISSNVVRAPSNLFIVGPRPESDSVSLFITGPPTASGQFDLFYTSGHDNNNDNYDLFTIGHIEISDSTQPLFIDGHNPTSDSVDLFVGAGSVNQQFDLFSLGYAEYSSSGDLYTLGAILTSGSMSLFIYAPPPDLYQNITLYMNGHELIETSGFLARPLDWFLKTPDYNPQIIGTFENVAGSVTIQIWDITDGQNVEISLSSSGCYQISDTGRWGWSTVNLPTIQGYRKQYFYLMTSDIYETFDGQFFLDIPERAKWIHPNDRDEYISSV